MSHPSATDSVAPNVMDNKRLSITKLTDKEICVDLELRAGSYESDEQALADVQRMLAARDYRLGRCQSDGRYCEPVEYTPAKTFPPVIVKISEQSYNYTKHVKTGNRETVCTDDLQNRRGDTVGCARYVEQDETRKVEGERTGLEHLAQAGRRYCIPNKGLVGPTTSSFDLAVGYDRVRVVLTGGKNRSRSTRMRRGRPTTDRTRRPTRAIPRQHRRPRRDRQARPLPAIRVPRQLTWPRKRDESSRSRHSRSRRAARRSSSSSPTAPSNRAGSWLVRGIAKATSSIAVARSRSRSLRTATCS